MAASAVVKVPEANSRSKMVIKVIKVVVNIFLSFSFLIIEVLLELIDYSFITFFLSLTFLYLFSHLWAAGKVLNRWVEIIICFDLVGISR